MSKYLFVFLHCYSIKYLLIPLILDSMELFSCTDVLNFHISGLMELITIYSK